MELERIGGWLRLLLIAFVLFETALPAFAKPLHFAISENSFRIIGDSLEGAAKIQNAADPGIPLSLAASTILQEVKAQQVMTEAEQMRMLGDIRAKLATNPEMVNGLKEHIKKTLVKFQASPAAGGFRIQDGVGFLQALLENLAPQERGLAIAMIGNPLRHQAWRQEAEVVVGILSSAQTNKTILLKASDWDESDLKKIIAILPGRNDRYRKMGDFYVLGGGFSYHATTDILQNGYALQDKALQKQFLRAANYAADTQLASFYMNGVGGSAMYNPDIRALMYSVMSRADLNAFTHEVSHARFHRFQEHLQKWLKEKKYALPFQLDGSVQTALPGQKETYGGIFTLLDELNAHRIGSSFDTPMGDEKIIKELLRLYGDDAGVEAAEFFRQYWTLDRIHNHSVPALILHEIQGLNNLSTEAMLALAENGIKNKNVFDQVNFLRLYHLGKFQGANAEAAENALRQLLNATSFQETLSEARKILGKKFYSYRSSANLPKAEIAEVVEKPKFSMASSELNAKADAMSLTTVTKWDEVNKKWQTRSPISANELAELDVFISANLFNGESQLDRSEFVKVLMDRFHPDELPKTLVAARDVLQKGELSYDFLLARKFLMPEAGSDSLPIYWGEKILQGLDEVKLQDRTREAIGFFYKNGLGRYFDFTEDFGDHARQIYNADLRTKILRSISELPRSDREWLEEASERLVKMLASENKRVRLSAIYAMLGEPVYLVAAEKSLLAQVNSGNQMAQRSLQFLRDALGDEYFHQLPQNLYGCSSEIWSKFIGKK